MNARPTERALADIYILLLRGVNVGGAQPLPMKSLVSLLEAAGCRSVRTYIQSGNAVFRADANTVSELPARLPAAIRRQCGFTPDVMLLTAEALERVIRANPFPAGDENPKAVHVSFLAAAPGSPDLATLEALRRDGEQFVLQGTTFYFHAPGGVGRSKLFPHVEQSLGVRGTARNWRTVCALRDLTRALSEAPDSPGLPARINRRRTSR